MSQPLTSVIVPTKNSARTIAACLESVRKQEGANVELIVVDNFSTDGTAEIARRFTDKVFVIGPERSAQRNYGASVSSGAYLLFVDSDMVLTPTVVGECVAVGADPAVAGVVIPEESFGKGFWAQCKRLEREFYIGVSWMEAARFFPRAAFERSGGYDELLISGEDWDISQRIGKIGKLGRIAAVIRHDEGMPTLAAIVGKKMHYAREFAKYSSKAENRHATGKQTSVSARYGLFFRDPNRLLQRPTLGVGMLFMKTCEFACGAVGYVVGKK